MSAGHVGLINATPATPEEGQGDSVFATPARVSRRGFGLIGVGRVCHRSQPVFHPPRRRVSRSSPRGYSALLSSLPSHLISFEALKDTLAKADGVAAGMTRPIYGCAAKRLLKIEMYEGEQVVKFYI